eukprot:m.76581 g.76581  ORF g.76581 m.76581 type:complete len:888 (+) comp12565_c0_seq2:258-2921(+)
MSDRSKRAGGVSKNVKTTRTSAGITRGTKSSLQKSVSTGSATARPGRTAPGLKTTKLSTTAKSTVGKSNTSVANAPTGVPPKKTTARSTSTTTTRSTSKTTTTSNATVKRLAGKVQDHVDANVSARKNAITAMGGVKIDVFLRIRPANKREENDTIIAEKEADAPQINLTIDDHRTDSYTFDKVFGTETTQKEVFEEVVVPIVEQVARGMSCCVYAYGQTGTGKTYTMRGKLNEPNEHGVIQRAVGMLLNKLHSTETYSEVSTYASFLEIYNEQLEDLFSETKPSRFARDQNHQKLTIVDDVERGSICHGLTEIKFDSLEKVMGLLENAEKRAKVTATKMNKLSNRAHRIFTVVVRFKKYDTEVPATLTFVDLAGSEDISKSEATGITAVETAHINKSLLSLGRVIDALAANEKHIPYRDSKLTKLMAESLGGLCKTSFIGCISPCSSSLTETHKTMRYAARAMEALNISQQPRWKQDQIMIDGLTRKVDQLTMLLEKQSEAHARDTKALRDENKFLNDCVESIVTKLGAFGQFVEKRINTHTNENIARDKSACDKAQGAVKSILEACRSSHEKSSEQNKQLQNSVLDSRENMLKGIEEIKQDSSTSYEQSKLKTKQMGNTVTETVSAMALGTEALNKMAITLSKQTEEACAEEAKFASWARNQFGTMTGQSKELERDAELMEGNMIIQEDRINDATEKLLGKNTLVASKMAKGIENAENEITEQENSVKRFVNEEFKRDAAEEIKRKQYDHPHKFDATAEYAVILADNKVGWSIENDINQGVLEPGLKTDYPGEKGPQDVSGIIEETREIQVSADDSTQLERAARESEAEEYSDPEEYHEEEIPQPQPKRNSKPKIKRRVSAHDPSLLTTQGILIDDVRPSSLQIM